MFSPQIPKTEEIKKLQINLYIFFIIGIILTFCKINYLSIALNELFQNLLLLFSAICLNYCFLVFFIILVFFNSLMIFQIIAISIQKTLILKIQFFNEKNQIFNFTVLIITLIFNIIVIVFCFFVYKKFKIEAKKNNKGNNSSYKPLEDIKEKFSEIKNEENKKKGFEAFKGEGIKIG